MKTELGVIRNLCVKYDAGKTSLEEERSIQEFFQEDSTVPADLMSYQLEFDFYESAKSLTLPDHLLMIPGSHSIWKRITDLFSGKWNIFGIILISGLAVWYAVPPSGVATETVRYQLETPADPVQTETVPPEVELSEGVQDSILILPKKSGQAEQKVAKNPSPATMDTTTIRQILSIDPVESPVEERVVITTETAPEDSLLPRKEFVITENSSSGALAGIARMAGEAGIEYTYVVDMRRNIIHELNVVMVIRSTGERSQLWIAHPKKSSKFEEQIFWEVDSFGKATKLSKTKIEHLVSPKHPLN